MSVRSSDGRAPTPPQKKSRLGDATSGTGSVPSSSNNSSRAQTPENVSEGAPKKTNLRVNTENLNEDQTAATILDGDALRCVTCGQNSDKAGLMKCRSCVNMFHAKCANLPSVPEEGDFFCRWSCFSNIHKRKALEQRAPTGDFSKLAAQIQLVLRDRMKHISARNPGPPQGRQRAAQAQYSNTNGHDRRPPRPAEANIDVNQMPRGPVEGRFSRREDPNSGRFARKVRNGRSSSRSPPPVRDINSYGGHPHNAIVSTDATGTNTLRSGRRSSSRASNEYPDPNESLPPASEAAFSRSNPGSGRNSVSPGLFTPSLSSTSGFSIDGQPSKVARALAPQSAGPPGHHQLSPAMYNQHTPPPTGQLPPQSRLSTLHNGGPRHEHDDMFVRYDRAKDYGDGFDTTKHAPHSSSLDGALRGRKAAMMLSQTQELSSRDGRPDRNFVQGRGSSSALRDRVDHEALGVAPNGKSTTSAAAFSSAGAPVVAAKEADVPWLNPSAFPVGMYDRFKCHADDLNRVFRIDLTPAFVDKSNPLYQSEIDFFFRYCS